MPQLMLSDATYRRIADFAIRTGTTASAAANEAIDFWMDTNGEPILHYMERKRRGNRCRNLVPFPKAKAGGE